MSGHDGAVQVPGEGPTGIDRRSVLRGAAALAAVGAAAGLPAVEAAVSGQTPAAAGGTATIVATDKANIVDTVSGKVRGFTRNGIHVFRGIPYAATTAGRNRFAPPVKVTPWTGVRSALYYGQVSPQIPRADWANDENAFLFQWDDGQPGEDCLRVNVWTPGLDARRRPVMVWIHGGGFTAGSGQEQPAYSGENLSRRGDVVVVSVNHRLGVLGYLNLAEYGAPYAESASAGMLDLVAALEWVRDDIASFGGDPGNVTIFGQSGGGAKVSTLLAMPAAKGLVHKAVVQSGSGLRMVKPEHSAALAAAVLSHLGIGRADIGRMHDLPVQALIEAQIAAAKTLPPNVPGGGGPTDDRRGWGPTVDGVVLPHHPFDPAAPAQALQVPMLIGTVLNETSPSMVNAQAELLSDADMMAELTKRYGAKSRDVAAAARRIYPRARPVELLAIINRPRINAITQASRKVAQGGASVYMYLFQWQTPILDGRPRAFHCSEIPFVFDNTDVSAFATGGTAQARALGAKVSEAWINFARKGNPNHAGLPSWPAFTPEPGPLMVFDDVCEVKNDPDRELRALVATT